MVESATQRSYRQREHKYIIRLINEEAVKVGAKGILAAYRLLDEECKAARYSTLCDTYMEDALIQVVNIPGKIHYQPIEVAKNVIENVAVTIGEDIHTVLMTVAHPNYDVNCLFLPTIVKRKEADQMVQVLMANGGAYLERLEDMMDELDEDNNFRRGRIRPRNYSNFSDTCDLLLGG